LAEERRIDIARAYGYKNGSAITQIQTLKRLPPEPNSKSETPERISRLEAELNPTLSAFRSSPHYPTIDAVLYRLFSFDFNPFIRRDTAPLT